VLAVGGEARTIAGFQRAYSVATNQTLERFLLTDECAHESSQLCTGRWLRGRSLLFDLGFCRFRRFALVSSMSGFFLTRLKSNANTLIVEKRRKMREWAISLLGRVSKRF
jgi:hypothetical protein